MELEFEIQLQQHGSPHEVVRWFLWPRRCTWLHAWVLWQRQPFWPRHCLPLSLRRNRRVEAKGLDNCHLRRHPGSLRQVAVEGVTHGWRWQPSGYSSPSHFPTVCCRKQLLGTHPKFITDSLTKFFDALRTKFSDLGLPFKNPETWLSKTSWIYSKEWCREQQQSIAGMFDKEVSDQRDVVLDALSRVEPRNPRSRGCYLSFSWERSRRWIGLSRVRKHQISDENDHFGKRDNLKDYRCRGQASRKLGNPGSVILGHLTAKKSIS